MNKFFARVASLALALLLILSAAACGGQTPVVSPDGPDAPVAPPDENVFVPVSVSVAYKAEQYATNDGIVVMESVIDIPTVTGGGDGAAAKIQEYLDGEIKSIEDELALSGESSSELIQGGFTGPAGSYEMKFSTLRSDGQVFSLLSGTSVYYMGAAHPGYIMKVYNFDPVTGERLKLSAMGVNGKDPSEDIAYLLAKKFMASDYHADFSYSMSTAVDDIAYMLDGSTYTVYDNWYISGDTFVFISNEYALASYAAGPFVITLSAEELTGIINRNMFSAEKVELPEGISQVEANGGSNEPVTDPVEPAEPVDPTPQTAFYNPGVHNDWFQYIYTAEIPSEYMEENLIWWNCDVYDIIIYELEWDENYETVVGGNIVYGQYDCTPDDAILLRAYIPEIIPSHGMSVTVNGERYHWALCYNGRDGGLSFMEIDPQAAG